MSDKPMTAEEIRTNYEEVIDQGGRTANTYIASQHAAVLAILDHLSAREREHAELRERVERLEREKDDGR